jgi:two-component sensor histidine kinase
MASDTADLQNPTVALLREVEIGSKRTVSLARVVRQRLAFSELCAAALLEASLDTVLTHACHCASVGCNARYGKVLEHRAETHTFIIRAGWGWKTHVVGRATANDDASNPIGEAFRTQRPVTVLDIRARGDYQLPSIYRDHGIVSTTNVPIMGAGGFFGVLEVDHPAQRRFDALDTTFLVSIAAIVAEAVARVKRESALRAAHNATALLLREHYHRVRNNFQTIIALIHAHAREATTENSRRRMEDIARRIFSLSALYDHLLGRDASDRVELAGYIAALCDRLREFYKLDERPILLECDMAASSACFDIETCTTIGIVINELVANALEHAFEKPPGRIHVGFQPEEDGGVTIRVADNGCGFQGTAPGSIGLAVARRLASWIGGTLSLASTPADGTTWTISIPRERAFPGDASPGD